MHRAWPKPGWMLQAPQEPKLPGRTLQEQPGWTLREQRDPEWEQRDPEWEPWVLPVRVREQPDEMLRDGLLRGQQPGRRTLQRRRRGRRREVSSRRGPRWLTRRSERIRPIPAVWLLHLWK